MAAVRSKNTKIETLVRSGLHSLGFRYRINQQSLPGKPDVVLKKYGAIIQVHGCFWHGHDCHLFRMPRTKTLFWESKIRRNIERDSEVNEKLRNAGWRIGIVWECALRGREQLVEGTVSKLLANWLRGEDERIEIRGLCKIKDEDFGKTKG